MRKGLICAALTLAIAVFGGCSKAEDSGTSMNTSNKSSASQAMEEAKLGSTNAGTATSKDASSVKNESQVQKKIIQTGSIQITVEDLKKTSTEIKAKIDELGGYVESENLSEAYSNSRVRVPADKLQAFVEFMDGKYELKGKNFSTQDVTDAYVDNDARIRNLKAQESQILEIMKRANTVEEVLKVQSELSKVRGEIESLESRKKVWDRDVDFSTININANKKQTAIESKLKVLSGSEFGKSISKGFRGSTTGLILFLQNIIIFLISNIIILSLLGVILFFVYKKYIKIRLKK